MTSALESTAAGGPTFGGHEVQVFGPPFETRYPGPSIGTI
jgi:hypothetical protein